MKRVLSLGAGVQSTTVLLMSCKGILPRLDCAIFADTQWEPKAVYDHLGWLTEEAGRYGIPVHVVTAGNLRDEAIAYRLHRKSFPGGRSPLIPMHVSTGGLSKRQCTSDYKIEPIEKFLRREVMGLAPYQRAPREVVIEQWFGISADEMHRTSISREPWKVHRYPLIRDLTLKHDDQLFESGYRRSDCVAWLRANYPGRQVPRSACRGCPYKTDLEWAATKAIPDEWADVVDFDYSVRSAEQQNALSNGLTVGDLYLHPSRVPLDMVDLKPVEPDPKWNIDGMANECLGMCGL